MPHIRYYISQIFHVIAALVSFGSGSLLLVSFVCEPALRFFGFQVESRLFVGILPVWLAIQIKPEHFHYWAFAAFAICMLNIYQYVRNSTRYDYVYGS